MQPFPTPQSILLVHREMVDAEMARHRDEWRPTQALPRRGFRTRLGSMLVAVGTRIDPTPSLK